MKKPTLIMATMISMASLSTAMAAGNPERGADVFDSQCAECHSIKANKNKKGPTLFASLGRKSASIADFVYSDAMKQSGITWTPDKLETYLANPKKVVPGGKMKFDSALTQQEFNDLVAFLANQH